MTNPTYFTVIADFKSVVVDLASDVDPDPQLGPVTAKVTFTPVLNNGDVILATNASPRPTVFVPAPIVARIDTDGRLKLRVAPDGDRDDYANLAAFPATGNIAKVYFAIDTQTFYRWIPGSSQYVADYSYAQVRMLADTGLLELDSPLYYKVTFSDVVYNGGPGYINSFTFQAPTSDTELNLVEVLRQPGQPAVGITKIAPGAVRAENGNLIFSFNGVDIPEPVPYADVNVTMSATDINDSTPTGRALVTAASAAAARGTLDVVELSVDASRVTSFDLDPTPLTASDVGAYSRAEVDDAIEAAKNGPELVTPFVVDSSGAYVARYGSAANGVNYLTFNNSATGASPSISATASADTNASILALPKGSGRLTVYVATGQTPTISGSGADTNHNLNLVSKGTGTVQANGFDITTTSVVSVTGTSTLSAVDNRHYVILLGSGAVATLPTAVGNTCIYHLKNVHTASRTVAVTSSQTIDGGTGSLTILPKQSYTLVSDGSNWVII